MVNHTPEPADLQAQDSPPRGPAPIATGLSGAEVAERVRRGQGNRFRARVGRSYRRIFVDNLFNLFNIVMFTLLAIVIWLGDYGTAFFAGFSVITNTFLGMIQEMNAKRKLDRLAALSQQTVNVMRDGARVTLPMQDIVLDDIILLEPGDKLVADGEVLQSDALELDESLLTGESDAISKGVGADLLSGTFVVAGSGVMRATAVGESSQINRLASVAKQYKRTLTPTQRKISATVEITVVLMLIFVPMLIVRAIGDDLTLLDSVRNIVVFVATLVPQGLVLVGILSLTIGAVKISMQQTLIQRVNAVESLANATTLCFDKTGTLTENRLVVQQIIPANQSDENDVRRMLATYISQLAHRNHTAQAVESDLREQGVAPLSLTKQGEIPFTSARKWGAITLDDHTLVFGAPERVLPPDAVELGEEAQSLSEQGLRVLAFVRMEAPPDERQQKIGAGEPLALVILSDKVRDDIRETLASFREVGIGLKVISGDNLATVLAVAREAGMVVTGAASEDDLAAMDDAQLQQALPDLNVFGRVQPDTKQRLIRALQAGGHYVAMVGDGVNDVPALKQADLAIVMNAGTQISKDVADIVLLNDAMSTLPRAFVEGREITQTIFATMKLFLTRAFYLVLTFVFIYFMGLPFPITPIQISWATFGTVNIPATLIAFSLLRPYPRIRYFRPDVVDYIMTAGLNGAVAIALLFVAAYSGYGQDTLVARTAVTVFITLFGMNIMWNIHGVDIHDLGSFRRHPFVAISAPVLATVTILAMYAFPELLEFQPYSWADLPLLVLIIALFLLVAIITSHGMRHRVLLYRFWRLLDPPPKERKGINGGAADPAA
jgi:cation-transporting P-type ATPase E